MAAAVPITGKNVVTVSRGARTTLRITIYNPPNEGIAGWTFEMLLYDSTVATDPVLTKTTGFTITNNAGVIELLLDTTDTSGLTPAVYYHKIRRVSNKIPIEFGPFILTP